MLANLYKMLNKSYKAATFDKDFLEIVSVRRKSPSFNIRRFLAF